MKIPAQGTCNPATLTAQVYPAGPCIEVRLTASCFGIALVMNAPLLGYVRTLLNLIDAQIHAQRSQPAGPPRAVAADTDRPADSLPPAWRSAYERIREGQALALANHQKHPEDMDARALVQASGAAMRAFQQVYEKTRTSGQAAPIEGRSGDSGKQAGVS